MNPGKSPTGRRVRKPPSYTTGTLRRIKPRKLPLPKDANAEISSLIDVLHKTGQRLEQLTAGEVDSVSDREGRTFLLRHAQEELRHTEAAKQAAILDALPAHIALLDAHGFIVSVNEAWRGFACVDAVHGPGHRVGANYLEICDRAQGDGSSEAYQAAKGIRSVLSGGVKSFSIEYPCNSQSEKLWLLMMVTPLGGDYPNGAVVMHLNITERKKTEARIVYLNRVYAVLSGINTLIVRVSGRDELFKEACRIAVEQGGFRMAWIGIINRSEMKIVPIGSAGMDEKLLAAISETMSLNEAGRPLGNNMASQAIREKKALLFNNLLDNPKVGFGKLHAEYGVLSMAILPLIVGDEAIGVLTLCASEVEFFQEEEMKLLTELAEDISYAIDHIGNEEKLIYLAYHDPLTGLANRTLLLDRLNQAISRARNDNSKVALMFGDIKGFRQINETMGREAGDMVLRIFADRLKKVASEPENVARINSDYFAGIVSNFTEVKAFAHRISDGLRVVMGAPYMINNKTFNLSTRLGIAVFPLDGDDADTLFKNAEAALLKAKKSSERFLFYQPDMNAKVAETLLLEQKLRTALEREEFILYYQPKINAIDGKLSGLEALIRWNDPDNGLIPPLEFIPLLEETGMILEVGAWAIRKALADHRDWTNSGLQPPRIAVNVSAMQLHQKDFVSIVRNALGNPKDALHALDLEITESLIMENIEVNIQKLKVLRDMGISIAIDDFGTGYSSLAYLTRLPVDTIKIDHSFVIKMTKDADDSMTIVAAIISLAHALNLKVVAEGVETEEHARFLRLLKCDELQGYFFCKPLPAAKISTFLEASREKADPARRNLVPNLVA